MITFLNDSLFRDLTVTYLFGRQNTLRVLCFSITTLVVVVGLSACLESKNTEYRLSFQVRYQGQLMDCLPPDIETLAFYLSAPEFGGELGVFRMDEGSHKQVTLVRFSACGPQQSGPSVSLHGPTGAADLTLQLGVPFELNHNNPVTQPSPLNVGSMFWTWRLGYKFLRLDHRDWAFHLGSGGCKSPSSVRAPSSPCQRPNLPEVRIPLGESTNVRLLVDLDDYLDGLPVGDAGSCMDGLYQSPFCRQLTSRLGLSAAGVCIDDCRGQRLLRVEN